MLFKSKTDPKYDRKMYEEELEHLDELIFYAVGVSDAIGGIKVPQRGKNGCQRKEWVSGLNIDKSEDKSVNV